MAMRRWSYNSTSSDPAIAYEYIIHIVRQDRGCPLVGPFERFRLSGFALAGSSDCVHRGGPARAGCARGASLQ